MLDNSQINDISRVVDKLVDERDEL
jgi:septal ring factor EnvC (AmiA/AmiB activator)